MITDDGIIREDQYTNFNQSTNFGSPEIPPEFLPHTTELNAILWKLSNDLVARSYQIKTVACGLETLSFKVAVRPAVHSMQSGS
jgi:hypothetical protein